MVALGLVDTNKLYNKNVGIIPHIFCKSDIYSKRKNNERHNEI